jgi:hypothetical protein
MSNSCCDLGTDWFVQQLRAVQRPAPPIVLHQVLCDGHSGLGSPAALRWWWQAGSLSSRRLCTGQSLALSVHKARRPVLLRQPWSGEGPNSAYTASRLSPMVGTRPLVVGKEGWQGGEGSALIPCSLAFPQNSPGVPREQGLRRNLRGLSKRPGQGTVTGRSLGVKTHMMEDRQELHL